MARRQILDLSEKKFLASVVIKKSFLFIKRDNFLNQLRFSSEDVDFILVVSTLLSLLPLLSLLSSSSSSSSSLLPLSSSLAADISAATLGRNNVTSQQQPILKSICFWASVRLDHSITHWLKPGSRSHQWPLFFITCHFLGVSPCSWFKGTSRSSCSLDFSCFSHFSFILSLLQLKWLLKFISEWNRLFKFQINSNLSKLHFSPLPLLSAFLLSDLLATHFRTNWLSWLELGNQVGSTTDHLTDHYLHSTPKDRSTISNPSINIIFNLPISQCFESTKSFPTYNRLG